MKLPTALAPFRHGPFARYISGEAVSMVGTWMQSFVQGLLLTSLTDNAFILGAVNFAQTLPMLLLTMAGGSLADRYDKRAIIQCALATQFVGAVAIGWLTFTGHIAIWHVFVAALFLGVAAAFEVPAVAAFVPELVPHGEMSQAIAIDRSIFHATRLIGPAIAGYLVGKIGMGAVYLINAATFLPLAAAVWSVPRRPQGTAEEEERRRGDFREGWNYVQADEPTRGMVHLIAFATTFVSPFIVVMMPVYARFTLHLEEHDMGLLMACTGIGSFIGSLAVLAIPHGRRALALKGGASLVVLGLLVMAYAPRMAVAIAGLIPMLIGLSTCFSVANIVAQERAPNELRGRVSAVVALSFFGLIPFSGLLISGLVYLFGMRWSMAGAAIAYGLGAMYVLSGRKRLASMPLPKESAETGEPQ